MTTTSSERSEVYEIGFHIIPTVSTERINEEFDALKSIITSHNGSVIEEQEPELMDLAYTMTHKQERGHERFDRAYFGWIKYEGTPDDAAAIMEDVDERAHILRYQLIKTVRETVFLGPLLAQEEAAAQREIEARERHEEEEREKQKAGEVSDEDIDKSIEELVGDDHGENEGTQVDTKEASSDVVAEDAALTHDVSAGEDKPA